MQLLNPESVEKTRNLCIESAGPEQLPDACPDHPIQSSAFSTSFGRRKRHFPGLIVVCFGRFWVRGLPFPNARHLGHPFQWKNTLPWHLGPPAKVRILRFNNLLSFRHDLVVK